MTDGTNVRILMIFAVVIGLHLIHISALGLEIDKDAYLKTENQFSTGEFFHPNQCFDHLLKTKRNINKNDLNH